jgi:RNA polymerase sigma factor (sigma-70 family)
MQPIRKDGSRNVTDLDKLENDEKLTHAIKAHYVGLKAALRRRGHSSVIVTDIVHDLYLKLAAKPEVLKGNRSIAAFLRRSAINLAIDSHRRARLEARLFVEIESYAHRFISEVAAPDHNLQTVARLCALRDAIAELPQHRRAVFDLYFLGRLAPEAIAEKLRISQRTVGRHLSGALAHCIGRINAAD